MASSNPLSAPRVTLFISGSSTYSLLMCATTSLKTPMCLSVSSGEAGLPRTLPIRSKRVRHVDALTTKNLVRLLIRMKAPAGPTDIIQGWPYGLDALTGDLGSPWLMPAHAVTQIADVGGVVSAVPRVDADRAVQPADAVFGMVKFARKVGRRQALQECHPPQVQ